MVLIAGARVNTVREVDMSDIQTISTQKILIQEFDAAQQILLFETLKQASFSGELQVTASLGSQWTLYFYLGRLFYGTGGKHPVRRWLRHNLQLGTSPELAAAAAAAAPRVESADYEEALTFSWEYEILRTRVEQQTITREQAAKAIWGILLEVLFDMTQTGQIVYVVKPQKPVSVPLILPDFQQLVAETQQQWQLYQQAQMAHYSLDLAPVIKQPEALQQQLPLTAYQALTQLVTGEQTLRDLACSTGRSAIALTQSFLPYLQSDGIELVELPDLSPPLTSAGADAIATVSATDSALAPLIACIDDSPAVCKTMELIVTRAGYRFVGIEDPLQATRTLIKLRPDVIFLDLVMPNTNGYEVCGQLRKVSTLRQTPIVILTSNDGIVDWVRSKLVGSTEFLAKPVHVATVLAIIHKYLKTSLTDSSLLIQ